MLKVAVTGGIGSGKTLVCKMFEQLGIPVFYADSVSKQILDSDSQIKTALIALFGNDIYLPNGTVDRKELANIIFNDKFALQKVTDLVHPEVRNEFNRWAEKQNSPYVIQEAAIIFENKQNLLFDKIITVTAPLMIKIERVMKRDKIKEEQVVERMKNQLSDDEKVKGSNFVIFNDEKQLLIPQLLEIHKKLI